MDEQPINEDKLKQVLEDITKIEKTEMVDKLIHNNAVEFVHDGVTYKVSPPSYDQRIEANRERAKKFTEMMNDSQFMMEADLVKLYAKRGIDIAQIDKDVAALEKRKDDLMLKLGQALKEDKQEELDVYKKEIETLNTEVRNLNLQKIMYLELSVESQVMVHVYTYLAFLCTMKKEGETFIRAFNTFDDFKSISNDLMNIIVFYSSFMVRNDIKL